MPTELELQIKKSKEVLARLEKQLKEAKSFFSLLSSHTNENDIHEKLISQRVDLAVLYKNNHQFVEAIEQLKLADDYYDDPSINKYQNDRQLIQIIELQCECSGSLADKKQQKEFLGKLLIKLSLSKSSEYNKKISIYLDEYVALASDDEGISQISYLINNLDKSTFSGSNLYKYALNLQADLFFKMSDYSRAHEAISKLIAHYDMLKKKKRISTHLSSEEMNIYLISYSLSQLHGFLMNETAQQQVENKIKNMDEMNYEVQFESKIEPKNENALRTMSLLYYQLNITPPKWFPKHTIAQLHIQPLFLKTEKKVSRTLNQVKEEDQTTFIVVPEHEKIREKITLGLDKHGVGGYKAEIRELVERLFVPRALAPEQLETIALKLPRGGILYGPPGTGKTLMARTIANYFFDEENVSVINGPALISKYVGQSAENLRNILEKARLKPEVTHVVIIDEIDALVCSRSSSGEGLEKQIKADLTTTLLTYLDGINVIENLMILGLTNYFDRLDDALIRAGRLEVHIHMGMPNLDDRLAILKLYISPLQQKNKVSHALDIELLAKKSQGLSGASIKAFIDDTIKRFALSQIVSFDNGSLKIGELNQIVPLDDEQFLICLDKALVSIQQKKSEQGILLCRSFCQFNQALYQKSLDLREIAYAFPYLNPMIINVSGALGAGSTSFALNLFHKSSDEFVYMKAGN